MAKRKASSCTVRFVPSPHGPSAVLFDRHGNSINLINYPAGHRLTTAERTRARKRLLKGCVELSRAWARER